MNYSQISGLTSKIFSLAFSVLAEHFAVIVFKYFRAIFFSKNEFCKQLYIK